MLPEIALLKYLLIYNNYIKYSKYINIDKSIYKELYYIYKLIPFFHAARGLADGSVQDFSLYFFQTYPKLKPEERDGYSKIFEQAEKAEVSETAVTGYFEASQKRAKATEIAQNAISFVEGRATSEALGKAISEFDITPETPDVHTEFVSDDLDELLSATIKTPGLRWRLPSLNKALGSLRVGDFGFIFARPETGKTTFLASEITYMAGQANTPILWFNNEEQGTKVKLRCFQAALGVPLERLIQDPQRCKEEYKKLTNCNIQIYDSGNIYNHEVERIVEECRPALIIFDQIDKIRGFAADRNDLVMGAIYEWARGIAKSFAPVIGVCQSDASGDGQKWLTMANVAEAKTSKQGEADWILGIGKTYEPELENVRHLHLSKNKLFGDQDSDPALKHNRWDVEIQPQLARYKDL